MASVTYRIFSSVVICFQACVAVFGSKHCSLDFPSCVELSDWPDNDTADPLLTDPTALDFHPLPGSPAIDTGVALADVTDDYEGTTRPQGNGYDRGALEVKP